MILEKVILLEEIIERNIRKLFLNYDVLCVHPFRLMRDSDLSIDEEEASDLMKEIEHSLKMRQWGKAIRLEVEEGMDKNLLKVLAESLSVWNEDIYEIDGPLDLTFLMKMYDMEGFEQLSSRCLRLSRLPRCRLRRAYLHKFKRATF